MIRKASRRKFHFIYKTTCAVTGKYYVGMHSTDDIDDGYVGSGKALWISIKKHGKENHRTQILEFFSSRKDMSNREEEIVNEEMLKDPLCMNLQKGGFPNREMTEKLRTFISERTKEAMKDPVVKEKMKVPGARMIPWNKGIKMPDEVGEKISRSKTGKRFGSYSEERKKAISDSIKKHWLKRKGIV